MSSLEKFKVVMSDPKKPEATGEVVDTYPPAKPPEWEQAGAKEAIHGVQGRASGAIVEKRINEGTLDSSHHVIPEGEGVGTPNEIESLKKSGGVVTNTLQTRRNQSPLDEKV